MAFKRNSNENYMIGDLVKLYEFVQKATDKQTEQARQAELDAQVKAEIEKLFQPNRRWPKGRRRFEAIISALGIFDDRPDDLRKVLFEMGARRKAGKDGEELWELVVVGENEELSTDGGGQSISWLKWLGWSVALMAGLVAIAEFFGFTGGALSSLFEAPISIQEIIDRR
jgi:hypothetical protein